MCGFYGWLGQETEDPYIIEQSISKVLLHRGPNDKGFEFGKHWGLGFRRLSILDLSPLGHQPMSSPDERYWLVFNGEIYNFLELKRDYLENETFISQSDSEVLLKMLIKYKERALDKINGMFAFVFLDTKTGEVIAARDRLGQKPFYYYHKNGLFRFASELKGLALWPKAQRIIDDKAVVEYLCLNYLQTQTCIFKDYYKLAPGHYIKGNINDISNVEQKKYWKPIISNFRDIKIDTLNEEFEFLFQNTVNIRLKSDVPLGIFLSGGIDSGLVAAFCAKSNLGTFKAYSVSFEDNTFDEFHLAERTAQQCGLPIEKIILQKNALHQIDELANFYDEPFGDSSALPTYNLCKTASSYATVFISGDGGDEAFAGYERYFRYLQYHKTVQFIRPFNTAIKLLAKVMPSNYSLTNKIQKLSYPDLSAAFFDMMPTQLFHQKLFNTNTIQIQKQVINELLVKWKTIQHPSITARQQLFDEGLYLPDDILVKIDRASMAHSIEVRSPFLDYRLIEWANKLDRSLLINKHEGKLFLRKIARNYLPQEVFTAKKSGFSIPINKWFKEKEGIELVKNRLIEGNSLLDNYIDTSYLEKLLKEHQTSSNNQYGSLFWQLLMFDAWARKYTV